MTGVSTLGQSLHHINLIKNQSKLLNSLSTQLSTGKKTTVFSGLGSDVLVSKRARADLKAMDQYIGNIKNAEKRIDLMLNAIEEFKAQADILYTAMIGMNKKSDHSEADPIYTTNSVAGNADLSIYADINALIAAVTPDLDPPNDQFNISFADPNELGTSDTITIDLSVAAAGAPSGFGAQTDIINYINAQIAALPVSAGYNALAVAGPGGTIAIEGTANIVIDNSGAGGGSPLSDAGLARLGLVADSYLVDGTLEIGIDDEDMDTEYETVRSAAEGVYTFLIDLLNAQEGDRYLLGGADTTTQPVTDSGTLQTALQTLIVNWKDETLGTNISTGELVSALRSRTVAEDPNAVTDSIIGYSAALSAGTVGDIFVRTSDSTEVNYTALANDQSFRDILVVAGFIKEASLSPIVDAYAEPYVVGDTPIAMGAPGATAAEQKDNFYEMFMQLTETLEHAVDDVDQVRFELEADKARINEVRSRYEEERFTLLDTISIAEDADANEVAVKISSLQIQLDASYRVTALLQDLSLTNYLSL